jgi:hypothetical protein
VGERREEHVEGKVEHVNDSDAATPAGVEPAATTP